MHTSTLSITVRWEENIALRATGIWLLFGFKDVFDSKHKNVSQHGRITALVGKKPRY